MASVGEERWKRSSDREVVASNESQQFILAKVHPLNYISAVIKNTPNVFCVHGAGEMWITVMFAFTACSADALKEKLNSLTNMPTETSLLTNMLTETPHLTKMPTEILLLTKLHTNSSTINDCPQQRMLSDVYRDRLA